MKKDWNGVFERAYLCSWPTASLCISNRKPGDHAGARNVFKEDRKEIEEAAAKHGYKMINLDSAGVISFIKK